MGRKCTVCHHPNRCEIESAIIAQTMHRDIAKLYGVSVHAVFRHAKSHFAYDPARAVQVIAKGAEAQGAPKDAVTEAAEAEGERIEEVRYSANRIYDAIETVMVRMQLLYDACHDYLADPANPGHYELGPRAADLTVTYVSQYTARGKPIYDKATLQELLDKIGREVTKVSYRIADPRKLIVETAGALTRQIELIAKIAGKIAPEEGGVHNNLQVNVFETLPLIMEVLRGYPEALEAVRRALGERIDGPGDGGGLRAGPGGVRPAAAGFLSRSVAKGLLEEREQPDLFELFPSGRKEHCDGDPRAPHGGVPAGVVDAPRLPDDEADEGALSEGVLLLQPDREDAGDGEQDEDGS